MKLFALNYYIGSLLEKVNFIDLLMKCIDFSDFQNNDFFFQLQINISW